MDSLFEALAEAADGAFVIDEDQQILYWNRAAQELLGYASDEAVGRSCHELLEGRDSQGQAVCCLRCSVVHMAISGSPVTNYDTCARTKGGEMRWINISILTFPASDDGSPLVVHLFRDATHKKQSEQFADQLLDAARRLRETSHLPAATPAPAAAHAQDLTVREREVLSLLAQGFGTRDIAQSLSISPSTARNHVQNILHKLHVHSRLEAVAYAFEHGLV